MSADKDGLIGPAISAREAITAEARFWLGMAGEPLAEPHANRDRSQLVAKYTSQVLCAHRTIKQSGTQWHCLDCEGRSS